MKNYNIKRATVYNTPGIGLRVQLPTGEDLPAITDVTLRDEFEGPTLCTATFYANIGERTPLTTEAQKLNDLVKKITSSEAARGRALQQLADTLTQLCVEQEKRRQLEDTLTQLCVEQEKRRQLEAKWWYKLFTL